MNDETQPVPATEIDLRDGVGAGSNQATESGRRFRARLIEHLHAGGYPVLEPGADSGVLAGGYDPANPAHLREAGRALARYHQLVRSFPHRFRAGGRPPLPSLERSGPHALACFTSRAEASLNRAQRARLTRASGVLWSQFIRVPEALAGVLADLGQLVIHGSYGPGALVFRGDRLAGVAGYDLAAYELRAADLAQALAAFAGDTGSNQSGGFDLGRAAALITAYREVEPLPDHEVAALPLILRACCLTGVLAGTSAYLDGHSPTSRPDVDAARLVDAVAREADRVRWLEARGKELVAALGGSLVA